MQNTENSPLEKGTGAVGYFMLHDAICYLICLRHDLMRQHPLAASKKAGGNHQPEK
jgi:hypothetical protein